MRLQRNKLGKYNEDEMEKLRIEKELEDKEEADKLATMKVGDRYEAWSFASHIGYYSYSERFKFSTTAYNT